jgi:hypothetical protein
VRQAYDDLAQPARLVTEALVLPALALALARAVAAGPGARRRAAVTVLPAVLGLVGVAELGRRRGGGRSVFPGSCSLWAPAWVLERGICVWLALGYRLAGGVPYAGSRLAVAAHRSSQLSRLRADRTGAGASR